MQVLVIAAGAEAQQQVQVGCDLVSRQSGSGVADGERHGADCTRLMQDFKFGAAYKACVISYETLRKHAKELKGTCDILICDEGHRYFKEPITAWLLKLGAYIAMHCTSHELCYTQTEGGGRQQND